MLMDPFLSHSKSKDDEEAAVSIGVYLEAIADLSWLSPKVVAEVRIKFNRGEFSFVNAEYAPKPLTLRQMVLQVHEQHATDEATRISGYQEGDFTKSRYDRDAKARVAQRIKLFNEFKEVDTFDTPALEAKAKQLEIAHG